MRRNGTIWSTHRQISGGQFPDRRYDHEIDAADHLTLASAWRLDENLPANREIASAKLYATEMLARITDQTLQIFGGMGLMDDFPIERFWRDARVERIWDGTSEIQRHIISRDLLRPLGPNHMAGLDRLFRPKSVAVIGGGYWARSIIEQCRKIGFQGAIYPSTQRPRMWTASRLSYIG